MDCKIILCLVVYDIVPSPLDDSITNEFDRWIYVLTDKFLRFLKKKWQINDLNFRWGQVDFRTDSDGGKLTLEPIQTGDHCYLIEFYFAF